LRRAKAQSIFCVLAMRAHHLGSFALLLVLAASCGDTQRDFNGGSGTGGAGSANSGAAGKGGSKAGAGGSATAGKGGSSADDAGEAGQGGDASGGKSGSNGAGGRSAGSAGSPEGGESGDSGSDGNAGASGDGGEPGSSGDSGAGGAADSGGSAGDGGTGGMPPEPEPFTCDDPLPAVTFPTVLTSTATPPQPAGGVITEGVYVLTQVVIYGTYSSVPGDVFELRDGYLHHQHTSYSSSGSALTGYEQIGTYATTGAAMAIDVVACGLGSGPGLWKFTANGGQIQLFTSASSTTWVQTFELQE
jgi:hypothetical protein